MISVPTLTSKPTFRSVKKRGSDFAIVNALKQAKAADI